MKAGDLVKMKNHMFWHLKGKTLDYTEEPLLVLSASHNHMRVMYSTTGKVLTGLQENYEVISEAR